MNDFVFDIWAGVAVPRNTSDAVVLRDQPGRRGGHEEPATRKNLEDAGSTIARPMTIQELDKFYAAEITEYRQLFKSISFRPVSSPFGHLRWKSMTPFAMKPCACSRRAPPPAASCCRSSSIASRAHDGAINAIAVLDERTCAAPRGRSRRCSPARRVLVVRCTGCP
jgi:hypothetical protein